jgi:hypothetical protein
LDFIIRITAWHRRLAIVVEDRLADHHDIVFLECILGIRTAIILFTLRMLFMATTDHSRSERNLVVRNLQRA